MAPVSFSKLRVAPDAKDLVDQALSRVQNADQAKVKEALVAAAGQDGNRYLTRAEVQAVVDGFEKVSPAAAGALTAATLPPALDAARANVDAMAKASNVDGMDTRFTFQDRLSTKLVAELNDAVQRAQGRRLDVNMMIFEFQSDEIETAIRDIAKQNPNVTFRVVADSGQATKSGGNALPTLLEQELPNVQVKFKKDFPYVWNDGKKLPVYNHGATGGLNHHKGFATAIDGMPDRLVMGSFNWSDTADTQNYEDMSTFKNVDASTRRAIEQYTDEFTAYFNNNEACLSPNNFQNFKRQKWNDMVAAHGCQPIFYRPKADDSYAVYTPASDTRTLDVNSFTLRDKQRLSEELGPTLAKRVLNERAKNGRFASLEELKARVADVATLPADKLQALQDLMLFGSHQVSINNATAEELDQCGFTRPQADAIVAWRQLHGDFESVEDLKSVPGVTARSLSSAGKYLSSTDVEMFFNSRPFGAPQGGTGYGSGGGRTTPVAGADGQVTPAPASVTVGATDLFNRAQPGQTVCVAMYGMSPSAPESKALLDAARRGVNVKVVLNDADTQNAVKALNTLKAQGLPVEVRVQTAKTMHEKFGVVGNDVFSGSANFSESSSTKHSEDRLTVKNHAETAAAFQARFDALWEKSRVA